MRKSLLSLVLIGALLAGVVRADEDLRVQIDAITADLRRSPRSAQLHLRRASCLRRARLFLRAEADLKRAERLDRDLVGVWLVRSRIERDLGQPKFALAAVDTFLERTPKDARGWRLRAQLAEALGARAEAIQALSRAIEHAAPPWIEDYLERARLQEPASALAGLDEGLRKLGAVPGLTLRAIELESDLGRYEAALERIDSQPKAAPWLARRGEVLLAAGRPEDALAAFLEARSLLTAVNSRRRSRAHLEFARDLDRRIVLLRDSAR